jgi:hypothetical protein
VADAFSRRQLWQRRAPCTHEQCVLRPLRRIDRIRYDGVLDRQSGRTVQGDRHRAGEQPGVLSVAHESSSPSRTARFGPPIRATRSRGAWIRTEVPARPSPHARRPVVGHFGRSGTRGETGFEPAATSTIRGHRTSTAQRWGLDGAMFKYADETGGQSGDTSSGSRFPGG